jgi:rhodanese-related sulfurtransferase
MEGKTCAILDEDVKKRIKTLSAEEVVSLQKNKEAFVLIDVRDKADWEKGHIKRAQNLPKPMIEQGIQETVPDKNTKVVLYCGGGTRSGLSADILQNLGYKQVYSLAGGWRGWSAKGLPSE